MPILSNSAKHIKTIRCNSKIYLLFDIGIYIYSQDTIVTYLNSIIFATTVINYSMDVSPTRLVYALNDVIYIVNTTNPNNLI